MNAPGARTLVYLISEYPAVSHTFIVREVRQLREAGWDIRTASIKAPAAGPDGFTEAERGEAAATFYVKTRGALRILRDHAVCLARRPGRYAAGLLLGLRLGGLAPRAVFYHLFYFCEAVAVGEWLCRNGLSRLHVHFANAASTVALLVKRVYGVPYSVTVHGSDEFYNLDLYRLREKIAGASFLCCISDFCRSQVMKASAMEDWRKMEVCRVGVDPEVFQPQAAEHEMGAPFRFLCVGRLVAAKGHTVLLEAIARLIERGRRVHLDLVGDGPCRRAFESTAAQLGVASHVSFHGSANQERVQKFLAAADAFVLPSFAEGVPVCLMEAMALEIPCVSTNVGGISELIESGEDGLLVPPGNADLLAQALEKLLQDAALRVRLGRAGRLKVIRKYNLRANAETLASIFERRWGIRVEAAERKSA